MTRSASLAAFTAILGTLSLGSSPSVVAQAPTYTVEDLGTIDGLVPLTTGINRSGQISGYVILDGGAGTRAVRFTPGIGWEYVAGADPLTSVATGINDAGDLAGYQQVGSTMHAFRYQNGSGIEDIQPLPNTVDGFGTAINEAGDVVGYSDSDVDTRAWQASPGLLAVQLPDLGGSFALACGINAAGQVVGTSATPDGPAHAFRVDVGGTVTDAGSFDGAGGSSGGCAIDEAGNIGGNAQLAGFGHAFRFGPAGMQDLDGSLSATSSSINSMAAGISVGVFQDAQTMASHALLYTDADGSVDLSSRIDPASGWTLLDATAVNADGVIIGDGMLNGQPRSYRLVPSAPAETDPPDTTAPVIQHVKATPSVIWPPNGRMIPVRVSVSASDDSGEAPQCGITSISSSEGSAADAVIVSEMDAQVRASKDPRGQARSYTIHVTCSDDAGNQSVGTTTVLVSHDSRIAPSGARRFVLVCRIWAWHLHVHDRDHGRHGRRDNHRSRSLNR